MNKLLLRITGILAILTISFLPAFAQETDKLKPTEVLYLSLKAMAENPGAGRLETVSRFFERIDESELDDNEEFARGEVAFVQLRPGEVLYQLEPFMEGDDLRARIAWQKAMQVHFRAYQRHDQVIEMIEQYWEKFDPDPVDIWHTDWQIWNFATKYRNEGRHDKVVEIILKEISRLPRNAPYRSFRLPVAFIGSFAIEGRTDEAVKLIREIRTEMDKQLLEIRQQNPDGVRIFPAVEMKPGTYYRMEEGLEGTAFEPGYPSLSLRVRQYVQLIDELRLVAGR